MGKLKSNQSKFEQEKTTNIRPKYLVTLYGRKRDSEEEAKSATGIHNTDDMGAMPKTQTSKNESNPALKKTNIKPWHSMIENPYVNVVNLVLDEDTSNILNKGYPYKLMRKMLREVIERHRVLEFYNNAWEMGNEARAPPRRMDNFGILSFATAILQLFMYIAYGCRYILHTPRNITTNVLNLSQHNITKYHANILSKGLGFVTTPKKLRTAEITDRISKSEYTHSPIYILILMKPNWRNVDDLCLY
ncbi:hypothetical protein HELRODRAFT_180353 [Helobdella robusta]|uniref:Uncharacterized protein n=1 Tax=Helobdella robusta TaxID=6412 RepID=T1FFT1_HELRO|nr:hypothetical protein HELRODRAFT_180353 [Helobdella robusta]ESN93944.1 hypothetical protein HELRODRAFT_180353 [Helobdella robusta]